MTNCKLCNCELDEQNVAKADFKMCKRCYSNLTKYRRLTTLDELDIRQQMFVDKMNEMFKANLETGCYVPRCYVRKPSVVECETCGEKYATSTGLKVCRDCSNKEQVYTRLLKVGATVHKINEYEDWYAELLAKGRRVPAAYLRRYSK